MLARRESQELERLVASARPSVRQRLVQKGIETQDLDDLCEETMARFALALQRRDARGQGEPERPTRYALAVADTVFDDYLRRARPNWCRLKRRVLYLLDSTRAEGLFARWKSRVVWIGGFARWVEHPFRPSARYHAFITRPNVFCQQELPDQNPAELPLPTLMAHLFRWLGTPVEVDELTTHLARLQNVQDERALSIEELADEEGMDTDRLLPAADDVAAQVLDALQGETFRIGLWQIVCALPPRQRAALLLGMSPDELLQAATRSIIADTLDMPPADLTALWRDLPLNDGQIAGRLDITPKQVSNLRKCARERIARWLVKQRQQDCAEDGGRTT